MKAIFYSFEKKINSTKIPTSTTTQVEVDVELKNGTSIESPTFMLNRSYSGWGNTYNYCKFENSYYFVDDITSVRNGLVEVSCSKDVLGTYATQIKNYTAFVERCADSDYYNVKIFDSLVQQKLETDIEKKTLVQTSPFFVDDINKGTYVFEFLNNSGITHLCDKNLGFLNALFNDDIWDNVASIPDAWKFLEKILVNPAQYVLSVKWMPVNITYLSDAPLPNTHLQIGPFATLDAMTYSHDHRVWELTTTLTFPTNNYNDFRKYSEHFSKYTVHIPFIGDIDIPNKYLDTTIKLYRCLDSWTGALTCILYSGTGEIEDNNNVILGTYHSNCAVDVKLGNRETITYSMGKIGDVVSSTASALMGNVESATNLINIFNSPIQPTISMVGSNGDLTTDLNIYTSLKTLKSADLTTNVYGRPCYRNLKLSHLKGFVKCVEASVPITAHSGDIEAVNNFLNSGVYIE